jgi:intracellular sulfur oxidation DsrE/DsrF family protein
MRTRFYLALALALAISTVAPVLTAAAAAPPRAGSSAPVAASGMVFIANAGLEDVGTLSSSLRHAKVAKESGHLDDVVWIVYGRAIVILDPAVSAVPQGLRDDLAAARAAGVRIVACGVALEKYGIDAARLGSQAEVVPNGISEVARLVAEGYALLRY